MIQMSDTEMNKATIEQLFTTFATGDLDKIMGFLDDDATWWVAGSLPFSGTFTKQKFRELLEGVFDQIDGPIKLTPLAFTAEGDRVAVETESLAHAKNGRIYNNFYHFLFEFRNGKVLRAKEYLDTMHLYSIFLAP